MLVEFASAVDAVRCAVEVQREIGKQNASVPQELRIEFRIGIHVGDIIIDDNEFSAMESTSPPALKGSPSRAASASPTTRTGKSAARSKLLSMISVSRP